MKLFDGTMVFKNKSGVIENDFSKAVKMIYEYHIWPASSAGWAIRKQMPQEADVRAAAKACVGRMVMLDFEQWDLSGSKGMSLSGQKICKQIITWMRDEEPSLRIGFFRELPIRNYWTPVNNFRYPEKESAQDSYYDWKLRNGILRRGSDSLAEYVDYVSIAPYNFYWPDDPDQSWKGQREWRDIFLEEYHDEALRYKKPIFAIVWHRTHPSDTDNGFKLTPLEWFRQDIKKITSESIEGVIWWGYDDDYNDVKEYAQILKEEVLGIAPAEPDRSDLPEEETF